MKTEKFKTKIELYICNHKRDDDECCFDKGAKDLTDEVKKWTKENHKEEIKVFRSGCLGKCSEGIAMSCYPAHELVTKVKKSDAGEIKKGLEEALSKVRS